MPSGVYVRSQEHKDKVSRQLKGSANPNYSKFGELNHRWKGDKAEPYQKVHRWIRNSFGKPNKCENDVRHIDSKVYDWANISGHYLYDISDWVQLCRRCHSLIDGKGAHLRNKKSRLYTVKVLPIRRDVVEK